MGRSHPMLKLLPSVTCIKAYAVINVPMTIIAYTFYLALSWISVSVSPTNYSAAHALECSIFSMKNFILLFGISFLTDSREDLISRSKSDENEQLPDSNFDLRLVLSSVITFSMIETVTYNLAKAMSLIASSTAPDSISYSNFIASCLRFYGTFIAVSFTEEIIFDFFHYWSHRILHEKTFLYRSLHSLHHHNTNPTVFHTFNDSVLGTIFTNTIPHLLALSILKLLIGRPIYNVEHCFLLVYKTFVEVSGHTGKALGKASSFPQFKWLPVYFGIELYTSDHHLHHRNSKKNFSKRFSLWDKVFGTYLLKKDI